MQTVADLVRADAAITITCRNCFRVGLISAHLLRDRIGLYGRLDETRWRCVQCDGRNVRMSIGPKSLAERNPMTYRPAR